MDPGDNPHLRSRVEHYAHTDWAREQHAEPFGLAAIRSLSLDSPTPPPDDLLKGISSARRLLLSKILALASKDQRHTIDGGAVLLVQRTPTRTPYPSDPVAPTDLPPRVYVPMVMRPRVGHTCDTTISYHVGIVRTWSMHMRFFWWNGMGISIRWWPPPLPQVSDA